MLQFSEVFENPDPIAALKYPIPLLESLIDRIIEKRKKENPGHNKIGSLGLSPNKN